MKKENLDMVKQAMINEYGVNNELATLLAESALEGAGRALIALANKVVKLKEDKDEAD